ncbi:hypothetical protein CYMTET_17781 [Cymbomonas tetramitiformis]|uniref:Cytidyltransferase-like domain-containing protein n=1 Tax=Cymbomonas tetramitiformis TaxID=36881 RepID=A0AAE0GA00_9CHLO|nr:hypothetical protein CYMTET_17781 [Cymbomonas tetramitiformis]|eukprot:gene17864-21272_t
MKVLGLTGGIGCGKSTVSRILLSEYGVPTIDADAISHAVLSPGTLAHKRVVKAFGAGFLGEDGLTIDRKRLGALVFADRARRRQLEAIQRPHLAWALISALATHFFRGTPVVCLDAALLFESGLYRLCSLVMAVYVKPAVQLQRLMARDGAGEEDARARIAAQPMSAEAKANRAQLVFDNNASGAEALAERVEREAPRLLRQSVVQRLASGPSLLLFTAAVHLARSSIHELSSKNSSNGLSLPAFGANVLSAHSVQFILVWAFTGLLTLGGLVVAFPSDLNVARGGLQWVSLLAACCVFMRWQVVVVALGILLLKIIYSISKPTVLKTNEDVGSARSGVPASAASSHSTTAPAASADPVLFAGSFNPIHVGHLAILRRIAAAHPRAVLYVCIGYNPTKKYIVSVEARRALIASMCKADAMLRNRVQVVVAASYPWRFALRHGIRVMYRGVRTWDKDGTAEIVLALLNLLGPLLLERTLPPTTKYIEASPTLLHVSSTLVRNRVVSGGSLEGLIPEAMHTQVRQLYRCE